MEYDNIETCDHGDVELIYNWQEKSSIDQLKRHVETKNYSAITVSTSSRHAALKNLACQLAPEQLITTSASHHPCKMYIYTPPAHQQKPRPGEPFDGMISTSDIAGCWTCACVPCGCACFAKEAQGQDRHIRKGVAFCCWVLPFPLHDYWVRRPGTNSFHREGDPGDTESYVNSRWTFDGLKCGVKLC